MGRLRNLRETGCGANVLRLVASLWRTRREKVVCDGLEGRVLFDSCNTAAAPSAMSSLKGPCVLRVRSVCGACVKCVVGSRSSAGKFTVLTALAHLRKQFGMLTVALGTDSAVRSGGWKELHGRLHFIDMSITGEHITPIFYFLNSFSTLKNVFGPFIQKTLYFSKF